MLLPCFCCHGAGSSIPHIFPWHFTVQIVLLLLTLCKTRMSLCSLQYARVPHQHRRAICRHKTPSKPTGFIRWGGEVKNNLLAGCSEEPEKEEPPWVKTMNWKREVHCSSSFWWVLSFQRHAARVCFWQNNQGSYNSSLCEGSLAGSTIRLCDLWYWCCAHWGNYTSIFFSLYSCINALNAVMRFGVWQHL